MGEQAVISARFTNLQLPCAELSAMQHFYGELLGMGPGKLWQDDTNGFLLYELGKLSLVFTLALDRLQTERPWARVLVTEGGEADLPVLSVRLSEADFELVVARLKAEGVKCQQDSPEWRNGQFWAFNVQDPSGYTVELFCVPAEAPPATA